MDGDVVEADPVEEASRPGVSAVDLAAAAMCSASHSNSTGAAAGSVPRDQSRTVRA